MAKKKLSPEKIAELRAAYEAWNPHDPNSESAGQLAARFGISKQTLYTLRNEWIAADNRELAKRNAALVQPGEIDPAMAGTIRFLTEELVNARQRIVELEDRLAVLETRRMTAER